MTRNWIVTGLAIFVLAVLSPFWFNLVTTTQAAPEPELLGPAKEARKCVLDKYDMRANHMSLLDEWRDAVVRNADRIYVAANGHSFNMS
ncbi:MAG: menaquinol oxidoreductase, partial [Desulfotignum sp.]